MSPVNEISMKKECLLILFLLILTSCQKRRVVQEITLDKRVYKFDHEIKKELEIDSVSWKSQLAVSKYTAKGNYGASLKEWDGMFRIPNRKYSVKKVDSLKQKYTPIDAKEVIIKEARDTKVTIINEAHHNSFHRRFITSLLKDMYEDGYRHLGLEALDNTKSKDTLLNERGYPVAKSGYYTQDPNFSLLVREAIRIGYKVFSYDQNIGVNHELREIEQAKNITEYMNKYPEDKFLIYCGFDHVFEGDYGRLWKKAMAERLKENTKVDPLTINQTAYSQRAIPEYNHPLLKVFDPKKSIVLQDNQGKILGARKGKATTDIAIFHPQPKTLDGRLVSEYASQKLLDIKDLKLKFPLMVWVFEENDDITKAVPIYIGEVFDKKENISIPLVSGRYSFAFIQENNKLVTFKDNI